MKRKFLAIAVAGAAAASLLAGCGSSSNIKELTEKLKESTAASSSEEVSEEEIAESASVDSEEMSASSSAEADEEDEALVSDVSIEEQVLVDQDGIKVTAKEYTVDDWGDAGIKLLIENNTEKDYTIDVDAMMINDVQVSGYLYAEVSAGKKSNETLEFYSSELEALGIETIGKIEIYLSAEDSDYEDLFTGVYAEIDTSEYDNMTTEINDSGTEIYNEGGIRVVARMGDDSYDYWANDLLLYIENNSGRNVYVSADDVSINGFMMDSYFYCEVYDGKKAVDWCGIDEEDLDDNGITSIDEVELKLEIEDPDTYETIAETGAITFTLE